MNFNYYYCWVSLALDPTYGDMRSHSNKAITTRDGNSGRLTLECIRTRRGALAFTNMFLYYDLIKNWFVEMQASTGESRVKAETTFPLPRRSISTTFAIDSPATWTQISTAWAFGLLGPHYMANPENPLQTDCTWSKNQ